MDGDTKDERRARLGMRSMFGTWVFLIAGGLAYMITIPLGGR